MASEAQRAQEQADEKLLAEVKAKNMTPQQRLPVWKGRWENSSQLQREFRSADSYSSYMEGRVAGRIRRIGFN